jgi:hypothetical protein
VRAFRRAITGTHGYEDEMTETMGLRPRQASDETAGGAGGAGAARPGGEGRGADRTLAAELRTRYGFLR